MMEEHNLPFAKIILLREDIAEVIIHDGVEMDLTMVDAYHQLLLSILRAPFSLLINRINSYTYSFEAQRHLGTLNEINVMAVVAYNRTAQTSTENLATSVPREKDWKMRIFSSRDQALDWLVSEQDKLSH